MKLVNWTPPLPWQHFSDQASEADIRQHRAAMRSNAMDFRQETSPSARNYGNDFSYRMNQAATSLEHAIFYRNLANQVRENLARRKAQREEWAREDAKKEARAAA